MPGVPATEARRQAMEAARRKFGEAKLAQERRAAQDKLAQFRARAAARRVNYPELNEQRKQINRLQDKAAKLRAGMGWNAAVGRWEFLGGLMDPEQKRRQDAEVHRLEAQAAALRRSLLEAERVRGVESTPFEDPTYAASLLKAGGQRVEDVAAFLLAEGMGPYKAAEALHELGYSLEEAHGALKKYGQAR